MTNENGEVTNPTRVSLCKREPLAHGSEYIILECVSGPFEGSELVVPPHGPKSDENVFALPPPGLEQPYVQFTRTRDGLMVNYNGFEQLLNPDTILRNIHGEQCSDILHVGSLSFRLLRFLSGASGARGLRWSMEDEHLLIDRLFVSMVIGHISLYAVFDGHGGSQCSPFLKDVFPGELISQLRTEHNIHLAITQTFARCDALFLQHVKTNGLSYNVGSVVNAVIITQDSIVCANLGDSRCVLGFFDGSDPKDLSSDVVPSTPAELERIRACGGYVRGGRVMGSLGVSRAIGDFEFKCDIKNGPNSGRTMVSNVPDITVRSLADGGDFLILACDGLFDVMASLEVGTFVNQSLSKYRARQDVPDPTLICAELIEEAIGNRHSKDNVMAILVLLNPIVC